MYSPVTILYFCQGVDEISNEQLKYGKDCLGQWIKEIFDKVWLEERIPEDWLKGIITVVPKKGDTSYCQNNRGITLRSTVSKLYQFIILQRLHLGLEDLLRDNVVFVGIAPALISCIPYGRLLLTVLLITFRCILILLISNPHLIV